MSVRVIEVHDQERGCGFRVPGGMYLTAPKLMVSCGMLPVRLGECPVCGQSHKITRGLTRINVKKLIEDLRCTREGLEDCRRCLINRVEWGYLMGVGAKFYPTRESYLQEAMVQGISKRIAQIPRQFHVGKSVVLLAHPKVFTEMVPAGESRKSPEMDEDAEQLGLPLIEDVEHGAERMVAKDVPGVICLFVPQRIEYVTKGDESDQFLEKLAERGIVPVKVIRDTAQEKMPV